MTSPIDPASRRIVVFAGVGGQGVLAAARFLGTAGHRLGALVTVSQLHGMSQRGGSVRATVSFGSETALAPSVGAADVLVALEMVEALRAAGQVDATTTVFCNRWWFPPPRALARGPVPAPDAIAAELERRAAAVHLLDASGLAEQAGDRRATNAVMLGALAGSARSPVPAGALLAAIRELLPPAARPAGERAFTLGYETLASARVPCDPQPSSNPFTGRPP